MRQTNTKKSLTAAKKPTVRWRRCTAKVEDFYTINRHTLHKSGLCGGVAGIKRMLCLQQRADGRKPFKPPFLLSSNSAGRYDIMLDSHWAGGLEPKWLPTASETHVAPT